MVSFQENLILTFLRIQAEIDARVDQADRNALRRLERARDGFGEMIKEDRFLVKPGAASEVQRLVGYATDVGLTEDDLKAAAQALEQISSYSQDLSLRNSLTRPVEDYFDIIFSPHKRFTHFMQARQLIMEKLKEIGMASKEFLKIALIDNYGFSSPDVIVLRDKLWGFCDANNFSIKKDADFLNALGNNIRNLKIPEKFRQTVLIPARHLFLALRKIEEHIEKIEASFSGYNHLSEIRLPQEVAVSSEMKTDPLVLSWLFYLRINGINPDKLEPHKMPIITGTREDFLLTVDTSTQRKLYAGELEDDIYKLMARGIYTYFKQSAKNEKLKQKFLNGMDEKFGGRFNWDQTIQCLKEMSLDEFNKWLKSLLPALPEGPSSICLVVYLKHETQGFIRNPSVIILNEEEKAEAGIPRAMKEASMRYPKTTLLRLDRNENGLWTIKNSNRYGNYSEDLLRAIQQNNKVILIRGKKSIVEREVYASNEWHTNLRSLREYPTEEFLAWIRQNIGPAKSAVIKSIMTMDGVLSLFNIKPCQDEDPASGIPERIYETDSINMNYVRIFWDDENQAWHTSDDNKRGPLASHLMQELVDCGKIEFRGYSAGINHANGSQSGYSHSNSDKSETRGASSLDHLKRSRNYRIRNHAKSLRLARAL